MNILHTSPKVWQTLLALLKAHWQRLQPREQRSLRVATIIIVISLLLEIGLFPAWQARQKNLLTLERQRQEAELVLGLLATIPPAPSVGRPPTQSRETPATNEPLDAKTLKENIKAQGANQLEIVAIGQGWQIHFSHLAFSKLHTLLEGWSAQHWQATKLHLEVIDQSTAYVRGELHLQPAP